MAEPETDATDISVRAAEVATDISETDQDAERRTAPVAHVATSRRMERSRCKAPPVTLRRAPATLNRADGAAFHLCSSSTRSGSATVFPGSTSCRSAGT